MKLWMFQWCTTYHLTLQLQWTLSHSRRRYDLHLVYISVSFGQNSRLDYQEYYGRPPEIQKRLFAQDDKSRSMWSNIKCAFLVIRALTTHTAITEVIKPPLLWRAKKNFSTIWSKLPNKGRCPPGWCPLRFAADALLDLMQWDVFFSGFL